MRGHAPTLGSALEARPVLQPSPHAAARGLLPQPAQRSSRFVTGRSVTEPPSIRGSLERVTADEVSGRVLRAGGSEPVDLEVRVNGEPRAVGRAEDVLRGRRLAYTRLVALAPG